MKEEMEIGLPEIGAGDEALVCGLNSFWRSVAGAALKVRSGTRKMERWLLLSAFHELCLGTEPTGFEPAIFCVTGRHVRPLHHGSWLVHLLGTSRMIPDSRSLVKCS